MNLIEQSVGILYTVTVALKAPVVLGILLALVWVLLETGGFLRECLDRKQRFAEWRSLLADFFEKSEADQKTLAELIKHKSAPDITRGFVANVRVESSVNTSLQTRRLLQNVEFEAARRLARIRIGLRLGPVLGLMGTLIPMGPALMNVSQGNLALMSNDLIIAFGTTVAGLLVGALCYVMLIARQYWYSRDIADIENLSDWVEKNKRG